MSNRQLNKKTIFFRCDANFDIGQGHLMRCLCLADAFKQQSGLDSLFIVENTESNFLKLIESRNHSYQMIAENNVRQDHGDAMRKIIAAIQPMKETIVILDNYAFTADLERKLKADDIFVCSIDDVAHRSYEANVVINHNIYASTLSLDVAEDTTCLLGPTYAMLNHDFFQRTSANYFSSECKNILLAMGGGRLGNEVALKVLRALEEIEQIAFSITVIAAHDLQTKQALEQFVSTTRMNVSFKMDVTTMPDLMNEFDLAIGAGGTLAYEFAASGLPAVILILGDNQVMIAEHLDEKGASLNLGWQDQLDINHFKEAITRLMSSPEQRQSMSQCGLQLFSTVGVVNIVNKILECQKGFLKTHVG